MLDLPRLDETTLRCSAIMNYAVYNTFNTFRANGTIKSPVVSADALGQAILNAVKCHPSSEEFVRNRWADRISLGPSHPADF